MWCFDVPWRSFGISQTSASVVASETCSVSPIRGRLNNLTGPETWIIPSLRETQEQRWRILRLAKKFNAVFSEQCICTVHSTAYQILGLSPQIGRELQAQNTITAYLCWSHNTSSLLKSLTNGQWVQPPESISFLPWKKESQESHLTFPLDHPKNLPHGDEDILWIQWI